MLGRSLGNYIVESKIGEGGMGAVYLARHVTLGRPVAIKVLHASMSTNQDMVTRFFNEARAATAVRNPGIVEVFDFGVLEDRSAYIVMEYLEGESLGARLRRGRMSVAAAMTIVRAMLRALQAAHDKGIVHRDLKPDNVFLVPDAELASGERVKLLDFGIAKLAPVMGEVSQTRTGMMMGTPTYMAPEQCRGAGAVDHRADLYALGCVAYQMMCGQPPFVSDGVGDLIARHLYFAPQPMRSLCPEIPADVDELVLWLLRKEPAARPASAADLIGAIDHLATMSVPGVIQTQPPTRFSAANFAPVADTTLGGAASTVALIGDASPPPRRRAMAAGLAAGVVGVAVMVVVVVRGGGEDPPGPRPAAIAPDDRAPPVAPVAAPVAPAAVASPAVATAAAPPAPVAVTPPVTTGADRAERKRRAAVSSRVTTHPAEPATQAEPPAPTPAPVPSPSPRPVEPPRAEPAPVATKSEVARTSAPERQQVPVVSASAVTKRSGTIPAITSVHALGDFTDVTFKLCIDEQGTVSSVKVLRAPAEIAGELQRALQTWRYTPYLNPAGVQSAACFAASFRVVFKS